MRAVEIALQLPAQGECPECLDRLRGAVALQPGVNTVSVDSERQSLEIDYDPNLASVEELSQIARSLGADITRRYAHETLRIEGMDCADCASKVEAAVGQQPGVLASAVSFAAGTLRLEYEPGRVSRSAISDVISGLGYAVVDAQRPAELRSVELRLAGLDCADCAQKVESNVRALDGVVDATVNFAAATLAVRHVERVTTEQIIRVVEAAGYSAQPLRVAVSAGGRAYWLRSRRAQLTVFATAATLAGFAAAALGVPGIGPFDQLSTLLFALAVLVGGYFPARAGAYTLWKTRSTDMNSLMTIAVIGAAAIGEWSEAAAVVCLFAIGTTLEGYTMDRARGAIRKLLQLAPREATIRRDDREVKVAVEEVAVGETVIIRPGERVSVDGRVFSGGSSVDQSPITGESIPVEKAIGDEVYAGTLNGRGYLEVVCERPAGASTIAQVTRLIEQAQAQRSQTERIVDRFARYYTPTVLAIAVLIAVVPWLIFAQPFATWFSRALVLLVISCPCALVISTPVSIVSGLARAAGMGVLIKGGAHLEEIGRVRVVAFDKTGTLTIGRPEVTDVIPLERRSADDVLWIAAAVEARSEHPLAAAVLRGAESRRPIGATSGLDPIAEVADFESVTGQGVRARLNGAVYAVGNPGYIASLGLSIAGAEPLAAKLRSEGRTVLVVADESAALGVIAVADRPRPGARAAVESLRRAGVERIVMLTGDHAETAAAISRDVAVDEVRAGLLPQDKVAAVRELRERYGSVAMVGDGINDAPALVAANVGVAMGVAGSDIALEAADVALMSDDLAKVGTTIRLARRTLATIHTNVVFSLVLKALFVVAAVPGLITLWLAIFADVGSSLIVTLNGMRLLRFREPHEHQS